MIRTNKILATEDMEVLEISFHWPLFTALTVKTMPSLFSKTSMSSVANICCSIRKDPLKGCEVILSSFEMWDD